MRTTMVVRLLGAMLVAFMLSGCIAAGGTSTSAGGGLRFTAQPAPSPSRGVLAVRLTLRNASDRTVTWGAIRFGVAATALSPVAKGTPGGVSEGIGTPYGSFEGMPLTLRSGEATAVVRTLGVGPGKWRVLGAYFGQGSAPSGRATPVVVVVR